MSVAPDYLTAQPRWLLWRTKSTVDPKTGELRTTKIPISYHTSKPADVTVPQSWADHAAVEAALVRAPGAWDGPGFALGVIEPIGEVVIGLDLDTCLDDEGAPAAWALPFLQAMSSYSEVSPSGTGIKVVARIRLADLPAARRLLDIPEGEKEQARTLTFGTRVNGQHAPGAQLFLMRRFFTITGRHWPLAVEDVALLDVAQIAELAALFGPKDQHAGRRDEGPDDDTVPDEAALRDKLGVAFVRNPRLKERWEGGTQGLRDDTRSGRDMSVLAMLVAAGFSKGETRAALLLFEHGKVPNEPPRYFENMWKRTKAVPTSDAAVGSRRTANVLALVTHINTSAAWNDVLHFNLLTEGYEICPPFPPRDDAKEPSRPLCDPRDILAATMYFQANGFPKAGKNTAWDAVVAVAHQNTYHPVHNYLAGLRWDGTARVREVFLRYFNAELPGTDRQEERDRHVAYLEHIGTGFMVGAVARVMQPGCKNDQVPVVVGPERSRKSSAIEALCCDDSWFSDDISIDLTDRDTKESLAGKWIIELAEIPHIRRETERVKAFFSRRVDRYRSAYGKASQDHPRQCVFIGTSNDLEFVSVTGNRRFWPFRIAGAIDIAAIVADRDQLWAEALAMYQQGVQWWLVPNIETIAAEQQAGFVEADIWEDLIDAWLKNHAGPFTLEQLFARDTGITPYREASAATRAEQMRAARCLTKLGWRKRQKTIAGKRAIWWESQ
jgi:Virulence-associated protein E